MKDSCNAWWQKEHRLICRMKDTIIAQTLERLTWKSASLSFHLARASHQGYKILWKGSTSLPKTPDISGIMARQQHAHNIHNNLVFVGEKKKKHLRRVIFKDHCLSHFRKFIQCKPKLGFFINDILFYHKPYQKWKKKMNPGFCEPSLKNICWQWHFFLLLRLHL